MKNQVNRYRRRILKAQSIVELALLAYGASLAGIYPALKKDFADAKVRVA